MMSNTDTQAYNAAETAQSGKAMASSRPPPIKRGNLEMDPESPVSSVSMKALLAECMAPLNERLQNIEEFMTRTDAKLNAITELQTKVHDLENSTEFFEQRLSALEQSQVKVSRNITTVDNISQQQSKKINILQNENKILKEQLLSAECYSRRDNLSFNGIWEKRHENCEQMVVECCQSIGMPITPQTIIRAHRAGGPYVPHRTRPILVRFHHYKDREMVWRGRKHLKAECGVSLAEDFPQDIQARRKVLYPIVDAAYNFHDPNKPDAQYRAHVQVDRLVLNGKTYTMDMLHQLPDQLQPVNIATPSHKNTVVFFTCASPFSNHHACTFHVTGKEYNCMEQYLMEAKALDFDDTDTAAQIMRSSDPVQQKSLGKKVANFDRDSWRKKVPEILIRGLRAKFGQNDYCKSFLQNTGQKVIGEANAYDRFFGIGLGLKSEHVWDQSKWGHNLLGKTLMELRNEL
jgi:hypothetical protein